MNVLSLFNGMSTGHLALDNLGIPVEKYYSSEIKQHAIDLTQKKFPNTIQVGDITKWEDWDINWSEIDLVLSGSPCFVAGTKVICKDTYKNIEDVVVGDYVLTHNNRFKKVLSIGGCIKNTIKIHAQGMKPTETTENHPYYVRSMTHKWNSVTRKRQRCFSDPIWKEVSELHKGDFVGMNIINTNENKRNLTKEDCWLIGRYIADGHLQKTKRIDRKNSYQYQVVYSVGSHKVDEFKENVKEHHFSCYPHTQSVHRCVIGSRYFLELLEELNVGRGAINKRIPMEILHLPIDLLSCIIDGYLSGDGSVQGNKQRASSISEELILTLALAVAKVYRVNTSYHYTKRHPTCIIEGRTVNQHDTYSAVFVKQMLKQSNAKVIDDIIWLPYKKQETGGDKQVYNLEVEEDNSYTANNIIVHNCTDLSVAGKRAGIYGEKSKLFFTFVDILHHIQKVNPNVLFFQENVGSASDEDLAVISNALQIRPVRINSSLVTAQLRDRYYWSNIKTKRKGLFQELYTDIPQPKDRKIFLKDILTSGVALRDKSLCLLSSTQSATAYADNKSDKCQKYIKSRSQWYTTIYEKHELKQTHTCLNTGSGSMGSQKYYKHRNKTTGMITLINEDYDYVRVVNNIEMCRLQGFPDDYCEGLSDVKAGNLLGDGWTLPIIEHIFSFIKLREDYNE